MQRNNKVHDIEKYKLLLLPNVYLLRSQNKYVPKTQALITSRYREKQDADKVQSIVSAINNGSESVFIHALYTQDIHFHSCQMIHHTISGLLTLLKMFSVYPWMFFLLHSLKQMLPLIINRLVHYKEQHASNCWSLLEYFPELQWTLPPTHRTARLLCWWQAIIS